MEYDVKKHGAYSGRKTRHFQKNMAPNRKNFGAIFHGFWRKISPSFGLKIGQGALTSA
ncbi:hypothetical protein [Porphyromonas loveana]|uniref:hypothetical protein n=1 Tax=Porphyromonas loveana TaxID=1884669 RepID=UPI0035A07106